MEIFNIKPELIIDYIGLIVVAVSLIMLYGLKNTIKGRVGAALNYIMLGIVFQAAALTWTIIFIRLGLFPKPSIDVHHLLMVLGMALFVFAAYKFSFLERPQQ